MPDRYTYDQPSDTWLGLGGLSDIVLNSGGGGIITPPVTSTPWYERGEYGTELGEYDGSIPAGSFYVDTVLGDDSNPGTLALPWRTPEKALLSGRGKTNVFRGSTSGPSRELHFGKVRAEFETGNVAYKVEGNGTKLMGAPGEKFTFTGYATVPANSWTFDGATACWYRTIATMFDFSPQDTTSYWGTAAYATAISTDNWAPLDGKDPSGNTANDIYWQQVDLSSYFGAAAARPGRLKYDGVKLIQVEKFSKLEPGRFFEDPKTNRQWIADNPAGHLLEYTTEQKLFNFLGYDQAFTNLGVKGYANSMPQGGVIAVHRARFRAERIHMTDYMAGITLIGVNNGVGAYDSQIVESTFRYGKSIHVRGTKIDRFEFRENFLLNGNDGLFHPAPACGGIKFTYLRDTDINQNKFVNAELPEAPGIKGHGKACWFDAAVLRPTVRNNEFWYTGQRSVVNELVNQSIVFNNLDMFPGAESQAFVDAGGECYSANNTVVGAGRLRGNPETFIKVGFWRGGIVTTVRDTRQRDVGGLTPPQYVYDGREDTEQWPGGNGNEAVAPLEPYPYQGNTQTDLTIMNNVYCRWDETAAYVDEEQRGSSTGVSWTGTGRKQNYNFYQPPLTYSPADSDRYGPNAGLAYLDNNTSTAVTAGSEAELKALGLDLNSRFFAASAPDIVDANGVLKDASLHQSAAPIPAKLLALLPPGVTLATGNRFAGRVSATQAPIPGADKLDFQELWASATEANPMRVGTEGDSVTYGAGDPPNLGNSNPKHTYNWPGRMLQMAVAAGKSARWGWVPMNHIMRTKPAYDDRVELTGTITAIFRGLHKSGCLSIPDGGPTTPTSYITVKGNAQTTSFRLLVLAKRTTESTDSMCMVSVDGGAPIALRNVVTGGPTPAIEKKSGYHQYHIVTEIPVANTGEAHTVKIWGNGATVELAAFEAIRPAAFIVDNLSASGQSLFSMNYVGTYNGTSYVNLDEATGRYGAVFNDTFMADNPSRYFLILALAANDYNGGYPLSVAVPLMEGIVDRAKAKGASVATFIPPIGTPTLYPGSPAATYAEYVAAWTSSAASKVIRFFNAAYLFGPDYATGNASVPKPYVDGVHPSDDGARRIAEFIFGNIISSG